CSMSKQSPPSKSCSALNSSISVTSARNRSIGVYWAGEKLVLHKLRFHPGFAAPFPPPCEGGVRGGGPGTTSHKVFPHTLPLSPFASLSRGEKNRFRFPRLPHHPPCPPFARGGKGSLARDVIPSRATKTRVLKSSLQPSQHQLFTGPAHGSSLAFSQEHISHRPSAS